MSKRDKKSKKEAKTERSGRRAAADLDQSLVIPEADKDDSDGDASKNRKEKKAKKSRHEAVDAASAM